MDEERRVWIEERRGWIEERRGWMKREEDGCRKKRMD